MRNCRHGICLHPEIIRNYQKKHDSEMTELRRKQSQ